MPVPLPRGGGPTTGGRLVWQPVVAAGRVVDLVLVEAGADRRSDLGLPAAGDVLGERMTVLFPDSPVDGRLAAFCAVAEGCAPFAFTRPGRGVSSRLRLWVSRLASGSVAVELQAADGDAQPCADESLSAGRWQRMFEDAPLGVLVMTFDGHVIEANRAVCAMVDRRPEEVLGRRFHDFAHPDDSTRVDRGLLLRTGHATLRKRYVRGDGRDLWLRATCSLVTEDGEQRILSICEDITSAVQAQAELAHRADHDPLTGLRNRDALRVWLQRALAEPGRRAADGVALLFLDLDRFKVINDSLGHAAGDRVLREAAARLEALTPAGAVLARLGGDEFALATGDPGSAEALARRLVDALAQPFDLGGRHVTVGASVGVALTRAGAGDEVSGESLLRDADTAMYAAKRSASGPVVVFNDALRQRAVARLEDEQGLRRALERGELCLHYQPIRSARGLRTVGFEALARWQHPVRGLLAPAAFLPAAEDTGLLVPLGRFALREACAQLARWRSRGADVRVAVNIAAQHLAAGTLQEDVEAALREAGVPGSSLTLEITEQALVGCPEKAARALADLREQGCLVALDDFGTGYSSLAYLRRLPVDVLKIDRTFVAGAGTEAGDEPLLRAITALGSSLGLRTVAEGVETDAELAAVRAAGATHAQGYLLGRPGPV